jgi:hypothetical protein
MVENKPKQIPCAFEPTKICPPECCINKLCKISSDRYKVPSETVSTALIDALKKREEAHSLCEHNKELALQRSETQTSEAIIQDHLQRV